MSEYTEVERPFLQQLADLGWTVIDQSTGVQAPGAAQLAEIVALSDEVEAATNAALAASAAVALTARVLDLSISVVTNNGI